nr:hypothetical protein [Actinomycetota bacterium]
MSSRLGPTTLLRRQLLADRGAGIVVVVVVLVVAGLVAAWPRAIEQVFTDGLRESVGEAPARTRDVVTVMSFDGHLATGNELSAPGDVTVDEMFG